MYRHIEKLEKVGKGKNGVILLYFYLFYWLIYTKLCYTEIRFLGKRLRNLVNTRKNEVILTYGKKNKNSIHLPRQESGIQVISWHSADTLGHSFPRTECRTTVILRMMSGKITIFGQSLNCVG